MPNFHPGDEVLLDYVSGCLPEAVNVLIATHLALCPECRSRVRFLEALGGCLLREIEGVAVSITADSVLRQDLRQEPRLSPLLPPRRSADDDRTIPRPLRDCLPAPLASIAWRKITRTLYEIGLPAISGPAHAKLIRIAAKATVPSHTHRGVEYILVLAGGFSDSSGDYRRGDVLIADCTINHSPTAFADEDCLCFTAIDGSIQLTGLFGRFFSLFHKA